MRAERARPCTRAPSASHESSISASPWRSADRAQLVELARVAEHVDGDDRARPLGDRGLDRRGVEVERARVDVGEDRRRALEDEAVRGGDERERRRDHLVARARGPRCGRAGGGPAVPLETAAAYGAPTRSAKSSSKRSIVGPSESRPERSTSRTSSSSRSSRYGRESGIRRVPVLTPRRGVRAGVLEPVLPALVGAADGVEVRLLELAA